MITVKELKELLALLPDDGQVFAYEGEDTGIVVQDTFKNTTYFIKAVNSDSLDNYTEGFEQWGK